MDDWISNVDPPSAARSWPADIEAMLRRETLQVVVADLRTAAKGIGLAVTRISTATLVARRGNDPHAVADDAWQAVRMAFAAHLAANGLRVRSSTKNHHEVTREYGVVALTGLDPTFDLRGLEVLQATRRSMYTLVEVTDAQAEEILAIARRAVELIAADLGA